MRDSRLHKMTTAENRHIGTNRKTDAFAENVLRSRSFGRRPEIASVSLRETRRPRRISATGLNHGRAAAFDIDAGQVKALTKPPLPYLRQGCDHRAAEGRALWSALSDRRCNPRLP